jgi:hypothetical protein
VQLAGKQDPGVNEELAKSAGGIGPAQKSSDHPTTECSEGRKKCQDVIVVIVVVVACCFPGWWVHARPIESAAASSEAPVGPGATPQKEQEGPLAGGPRGNPLSEPLLATKILQVKKRLT